MTDISEKQTMEYFIQGAKKAKAAARELASQNQTNAWTRVRSQLGQLERHAPGTAMHSTFRDVPTEQRLEFPVAENMQLGFATGIAMAGGKVCTCYPRINFFIEALPQLVQHLDKIPLFSDYRPRVIIRTSVATKIPLDPGVQHIGDYSSAIEAMLSTVKVVRLEHHEQIVPEYKAAMERNGSTLLVEWVEFYHK